MAVHKRWLKVEIELENAAFQDGALGQELKRIIGVIRSRISGEVTPARETIQDANGNTVGWWFVYDQDD